MTVFEKARFFKILVDALVSISILLFFCFLDNCLFQKVLFDAICDVGDWTCGI